MHHLSIIIPAYNEVGRLPTTLVKLRKELSHFKDSYELLVINDGSTDETADVVTKAAKEWPELKLVDQKKNQGKGGAVRVGMLQATGAWRLFMDADLSTDFSEITKLQRFAGEFPVVIGSRYAEEGSITVKQPFIRRLISRMGNGYIRLMVLPGISDTQCGFKLFRADAADAIFRRQRMNGWAFDVEILTIAHSLGYPIKEVPVTWSDAKDSKLRAARAAWHTLRDVWTIRRMVRAGVYR